jgi:hypothetical protein
LRHHLQWAAVDVVVVYVLLRHGMTNAHAHSWKDQPTTRVLWGDGSGVIGECTGQVLSQVWALQLVLLLARRMLIAPLHLPPQLS